MEAPVLHHWVPSWLLLKLTLPTIALILSIIGNNGKIHLVVFQSQLLRPSELNYDTHNKELLAIFDAFTQ
jgi:hypothetical protein